MGEGEAKEQWLSALASPTALCIREQQDARQCAPAPFPLRKAQGPRVRLSRLNRVLLLDLIASLILRTPVQPSPPPSHKLGQIGNFDVEIADVDVPGNLGKVDVLHSRHGPCRGC